MRRVAIHQAVQRLLLVGVRLERAPAPAPPVPPRRLEPLIAAIAPAHEAFDALAIQYGHRYRSGFWAIYVLSAIAVLFAVLPLALGWDDARHLLHPFVGLWAVGEVLVIGTVAAIYWRGHRRDWQGEWLRARTTAELSWYLPMLAPLVDFGRPAAEPNWYLRVFDPGAYVRTAGDVAALCARTEPLARELVPRALADPEFAADFARWAIEILEGQRHYHRGVKARQHALQHRVHALNGWLFGLTAAGALTHLVVHTLWLSLVTTFFPALGASLHGALAQSEAYRLEATSERLVGELQGAIDRIRAAARPGAAWNGLQSEIEAALALILQEHQDWHMLVRPHHLPLG